MKNNSKYFSIYALVFILGVGIFLFGLFYGKHIDSTVFIGLTSGAGIIVFSGALTKMLTAMLPENEQKKMEIELKDERNTLIRQKAAWETQKVLIVLMSVGGFVLALSGNIFATCILAGILLVDSICIILFSNYYNKRM